jgi:large exoprotein involved in heme utilization and adhesion
MNNSSIRTEASTSSGGQITITAPEMVQLNNSKITTSVAGSASDTHGGDITIDPQFVILNNSEILAQAFAGTGGNITLTSNVFLADPNSLVDASSQLGVSGVVDIRSPVSNISGVIGRMPESVLAAQALLRAACAARLAESQVSTFVERGRDSIPMGPDGLLATPYIPPSSEPSVQLGLRAGGGRREAGGEAFGTSAVQVRRLFGPDLTPRVHLLSGDIACGS